MNSDPIPMEDLYPLAEATRKLPGRRPGKRISRSTLDRWRLRGVHGVVLRTLMVGGTVCTCDEWINDFLAQLNATRPAGNAPAVRTPTQRERAAAQAREQLKAAWGE